MSRNDWMSIAGFLLFMTGMLSLILSLIGIRFTFLAFLEYWGSLVGFLLKLVLIMAGFILIYLSKTEYPGRRS